MERQSMNNINDIPKDTPLVGYYWMSDATEPHVLNHETLPEEFYGLNPFVVEAELYDEENCQSFSVHHAGNITACTVFKVKPEDISNEKDENIHHVFFYPVRMKDVGKLKFLEYWEPVADQADACLGMPSLRMTKRVFVGFIKEEEKQ